MWEDYYFYFVLICIIDINFYIKNKKKIKKKYSMM